MSRPIKEASHVNESNRILDEAVRNEIIETGCKQQDIALAAGMKLGSVNLLSMLKKTDRSSLQMATRLKRALPNLDLSLYVGSILSEDILSRDSHDIDDAQEAFIKFCEFFAELPPLDKSLISVLNSARNELSGFIFPEDLSAETKMGIKALIVADIQRATREFYDLDGE